MRPSILTRSCTNPGCKQTSRALCNCCNQYLCMEHLKDHAGKSDDNRLSSFLTEIDVLSDRLHHISNVEPFYLTTLDKWRNDAYRTIDRFYEAQRRHFEQFLQENHDKHQNEIDSLRLKVNNFMRDKIATQDDIRSIKEKIKLIEKDFNDLSHMQCNVRPLVIDESFATLRSNKITYDLLPLSRPYKTINVIDDSYCWIATNDRHLLIHHKPDLFLLDRQLSLVEKLPWTHGRIYIMCWSSTLNRYIVITNDTIFTVDENLTDIERCDIVQSNSVRRNWRSGTVSNANLFLSTGELGSSIYEFTLVPPIKLVKEWPSPITCRRDECIDDLCYHKDKFAIVIFRQPTSEIRMDLRSSATLDIIWSIELGNNVPRRTTGCCWLNNDDWLITDEYDFRLLHVSSNGHFLNSEEYDPAPYNALLFGKDILAIRTIKGINLHKLP